MKKIFYFEDDPTSMEAYYQFLLRHYEVDIGAHRGLIEQPRDQPYDLVIVDLMIHHENLDMERRLVENLHFEGINWQATGAEFLRRLRQGKYEGFGIPAQVPVIVATASVDQPMQDEVRQLGVDEYIEKPFSFEELLQAIEEVFARQAR